MEKEAALKILSDLIAIPSVNGQEALVADYLTTLFNKYPVQIERVNYAPKRDNLVVTIGNHGPLLGFSGHEDVVDAGAIADWDYPPFQATVQNGRLYGRGASDMKSGLAAMVVAMLDLLESGKPLAGRLRLLASVGEETGEYGAAQLTQAGYADDLQGLVIGEPTDLQVRISHKGVIDYKLESNGKSVHSSQPELGKNAILPLIDFIQKVQTVLAQDDQIDPTLGALTHVISQIQGGSQINTVPAHAWLTGNIRTIPAYPNEMVMQQLNEIVAQLNQQGAQLSLTYSYPEPPLPTQANTALAQLALRVLQQQFNLNSQLTVGTGATDASEYYHVPNLPVIILGPADGVSDHQPNEFVSIDKYLRGCQFYRTFAENFWQRFS